MKINPSDRIHIMAQVIEETVSTADDKTCIFMLNEALAWYQPETKKADIIKITGAINKIHAKTILRKASPYLKSECWYAFQEKTQSLKENGADIGKALALKTEFWQTVLEMPSFK